MTRSVLNFALLEPRGAPVGDPDPLNEQTRCAMSGESPRQAVHSRAVAKLDPGRRRGRPATGFFCPGARGLANRWLPGCRLGCHPCRFLARFLARLILRFRGRRDGVR